MFKITFSALLVILTMEIANAQVIENRVPRIFTGNSPDKWYQGYSPYNNINDDRDSSEFAEYYYNPQAVEDIAASESIQSVHAHVRNIAKDGLCNSQECFRVYIFINGNEETGTLVATFVTSPGTGSKTPTLKDKSLRKYDPNVRSLTKYEKPTMYDGWDMYRIYGSKSYPGSVPNMPNALFVTPGIALHGSFDTVDGNKRSHGCVRMFPDESYWVHSLVIRAKGNFTMDTLHTK